MILLTIQIWLACMLCCFIIMKILINGKYYCFNNVQDISNAILTRIFIAPLMLFTSFFELCNYILIIVGKKYGY